MGKFTKGLTERRNHTKISQGYCLICGRYGSLSWDHVPPQGSITITRVEQVHLTELMGVDPAPVIGVKSTNGSKFKTICGGCNSKHIGTNDQEVARVFRELTGRVKHHFKYASNHLNYITIEFDAIKFCRAMIGHVLSATTVQECQSQPVSSPYYSPLQDFVMGNNFAIDETHDIYCWFYPYRRHTSVKMFAFKNRGHICTLSTLSFFPLAFLLTEKGKGIYPAGATKIELSDPRLYVNLSSGNLPYSGFPFTGLVGDQMLLLTDAQAIVSYPI